MYLIKQINSTDSRDFNTCDYEEAKRIVRESKLIEKITQKGEKNNLNGLYKYLQGGDGSDDFHFTLIEINC